MNNDINESKTREKFITPAIKKSGWNTNQIKEEVSFTDGKIIIDKDNEEKRKKGKRADYILYYKNFPLAIVEAKRKNLLISDGIQQAIDYAEILDVPFAYSSNGEGFSEHNMSKGKRRNLAINEFPSPEELWNKYCEHKNITDEDTKLLTADIYYDNLVKKEPRYYQRIAINRTIKSIINGKKRILLVMATGTGKTFTASQIVYKLKEKGRNK